MNFWYKFALIYFHAYYTTTTTFALKRKTFNAFANARERERVCVCVFVYRGTIKKCSRSTIKGITQIRGNEAVEMADSIRDGGRRYPGRLLAETNESARPVLADEPAS